MKISSSNYDAIDSYLLNKLSDIERNEFEIEMLNNPDLLREVQLKEAMINELKLAQDLVRSDESQRNTHNVIRLNFSQWIQQPFSIAAGLVIAIGAAVITQSQTETASSNTALSDFSAFRSTIVLESFRGSDDRIVAEGAAPVLLSIDAGPPREELFTVNLVHDDSGEIIYSESGIDPDEQGWLRLLINEDLNGNYTIEVLGATTTSSYPLQFID